MTTDITEHRLASLPHGHTQYK